MLGSLLPDIRTAIPGPEATSLVDVLAAHECPAITARRARRAEGMGRISDDPFVWSEAAGANVVDVDGNRFVDMTAGFAVSLVGHRHPGVVSAIQQQSERLLHAMGDAWPDATRIELLSRLAGIAPEGIEVSILGLSGADAIDAAIKTARLATGRPGILTFEGGYHGLSLGALALQGYKRAFTEPFADIAHGHVTQLPFGCDVDLIRHALKSGTIGMVMVEPIQGRGGVRVAPEGWLADVATAAREAGALFALDEIQTGLGRTGSPWEGPAQGVVPDILCTGKALGGGMPLSACMGSREVMDAWGASTGEAIHTQTFLGHPVGCAAALAVLDLIASGEVARHVQRAGDAIRAAAAERGIGVQGKGLLLGLQLPDPRLALCRDLQNQGYIVLPAGMKAEVLCLTPPMVLTEEQVQGFFTALDAARERTDA